MTRSSRFDVTLAAVVFLPGLAFVVINAVAPSNVAQGPTSGAAAVVLSGAVAAIVLLWRSRYAYVVALLWSAFSVAFEAVQASQHHAAGADRYAAASGVLFCVRLLGVVLSVLGFRNRR